MDQERANLSNHSRPWSDDPLSAVIRNAWKKSDWEQRAVSGVQTLDPWFSLCYLMFDGLVSFTFSKSKIVCQGLY